MWVSELCARKSGEREEAALCVHPLWKTYRQPINIGGKWNALGTLMFVTKWNGKKISYLKRNLTKTIFQKKSAEKQRLQGIMNSVIPGNGQKWQFPAESINIITTVKWQQQQSITHTHTNKYM